MISTPVIQGIYVVQPMSDNNNGVSGRKSKAPSSMTSWYNPIMYLCAHLVYLLLLGLLQNLLLEIGILCRRIKMNVKPTFVSRPAPTQFPWVRFLETWLVDFLTILTRVYKVTVVGWTQKTTQLRGRGCVGGRCQLLCLRIPLWFVYACSFAGDFETCAN
jgi:hypothetical protein